MKKLSLQIMVLIFTFVVIGRVSAQDSEFKPSGNVWGYVFGDYYWKAHSDSMGRGGKNVQYGSTQTPAPNGNGANAFQIRRAYVGYDYNLTSKISAFVVLANEQNVDGSGYNTTYLKYAYLRYTDIFKGSNLFIGQMPTPSFAMTPYGTEPLWGYRAVERTIMDMHNLDASSDLGVALQGNLWKGKTSNDTMLPAIIGYEAQFGNGNSAKPENDMFKKFRGTVYTSLMNQKLTIGLYADYVRTQLDPYKMDAKTFKLYANYKTRVFKIGFEIFEQVDGNSDEYFTGKTANYSKGYYQNGVMVNGVQQGWSVFLSGKILKKLNYYARVDEYNPDSKFDNAYQATYVSTDYGTTGTAGKAISLATLKTNTSTYKQTFVTAGLDYTITPRLHIMPNIWYNSYSSQLSNVITRDKSDYDLVPRITFYFIFNTSKKIQNNGMDI